MSFDKKIKYINRERILDEFQRLVSFDSPSYQEKAIADYLKEKLLSLGLEVKEDNAAKELFSEDNTRIDAASNIYGYLKGNVPGEPVLFSSHLDTVSPETGKKAVIHEDGKITSEGETVLGADDVSGLVSILEALTIIRDEELEHPDIEILFTVAEEPYCSGSRFVQYDRLKSKIGYVLDLTGPVGTAAIAAPSIISLNVQVKGKAAHAGFEPEKGINALSMAAEALAGIRTGRLGNGITVNFGTISGGTGKNIVPEAILIEGEIRGLNHEKAQEQVEVIKKVFESSAEKYGGEIIFKAEEHIRAYSVAQDSDAVRRFKEAANKLQSKNGVNLITTYGGSDANRFNEHGIETIVLSCGMENCHSCSEYTTIEELERSALLTLKLMQLTE